MTALVQFERWRPGRSPLRRHWWANGLCAVGALVMHALLISPMVLAPAVHKKPRKPELQGPGASAIVSSAEFVTLILIDEPDRSRSLKSAIAALASRGVPAHDESMRILSPDPNPAFEVAEEREHQSAVESAAPDAGQHALMFGRYIGQISARIERAWVRPRTPVHDTADRSLPLATSGSPSHAADDDAFSCQIQTLQDSQGKVLEVMLLDCNGSLAWQQSLVAAIQNASPFPAPPHPSVFTTSLVLRFEGRSYDPGDAAANYAAHADRSTRL